jgi:hypothetical protein
MTKLKSFKAFTTTKTLLIIVVILVVLCATLSIMKQKEGFYSEDDVISGVHEKLDDMTDDELKSTITAMRQRLVKYGLLPGGETEIDRSQWVPKSQIPPSGPRVDMSQYVKKSSIPPEKVCPPQKEIDYSQYVKKSTLPPSQKCPPCIAPKVKVSAGLCKKCPECPKCPPPTRCPTVTCPEPKPIEQKECPKCSEIKYIKVPTIITRTIVKDSNNNVIEETEETKQTTPEPVKTLPPTATRPVITTTTRPVITTPTTTKPTPEEVMEIPATTRQQNEAKSGTCNAYGLNSAFKRFGIYGPVQ